MFGGNSVLPIHLVSLEDQVDHLHQGDLLNLVHLFHLLVQVCLDDPFLLLVPLVLSDPFHLLVLVDLAGHVLHLVRNVHVFPLCLETHWDRATLLSPATSKYSICKINIRKTCANYCLLVRLLRQVLLFDLEDQ